MQENTFDYIIAGGGMSGLSLAFYFNESETLRDKKILIIDRDEKNTNDHTWCFWEKGNRTFDEIIFRRWDKFWFHGTSNFSELLSLENYQYKMIRAIDFYEFIIPKLKSNSKIQFLQADILEVKDDSVKTSEDEFIASKFIFDSFTRKAYDNPKYHNLWQHFLGWTVETNEEVFNSNEPTLFDFRVEQNDECRFVYVMPISEKKALIEFTVFSDNLIEREEYEANMKTYISDIIEIENYQIKDTEFGIIPMSDEPHNELIDSKIVRIGTAGGYVKASTGYSFRRTQERLKQLVKNLTNNQKLDSKNRKWKSYMDSVLLNVLQFKKHSADDVFTHLFKFNSATEVLRFLDEDTSFAEDLKIMRSVPISPFTKAAVEVLTNKLK